MFEIYTTTQRKNEENNVDTKVDNIVEEIDKIKNDVEFCHKENNAYQGVCLERAKMLQNEYRTMIKENKTKIDNIVSVLNKPKLMQRIDYEIYIFYEFVDFIKNCIDNKLMFIDGFSLDLTKLYVTDSITLFESYEKIFYYYQHVFFMYYSIKLNTVRLTEDVKCLQNYMNDFYRSIVAKNIDYESLLFDMDRCKSINYYVNDYDPINKNFSSMLIDKHMIKIKFLIDMMNYHC